VGFFICMTCTNSFWLMRKFFVFVYLIPLFTFGQRGVVIDEGSPKSVTGETYALIMGVSEYKNAKIPDLKYADRDALVFEKFLLSSGISASNVFTLLNEQATFSAFWSTLHLLSVKMKVGDRIFLYFSGHGDVENETIVKDAYLLPYDAPEVVYTMGGIGVVYLKSWIATFSSKGIQPILIVDACRSGNLIGGREGIEATANILKDKWQDEVKIVSCQPGELSLEGEQWGGGRGLFSYELINGLCGGADKNLDGLISLRELNLFLLQTVPEKAGFSKQNPIVSGDLEQIIFEVNASFHNQNDQTVIIASNETKSQSPVVAHRNVHINLDSTRTADTLVRHHFETFERLLHAGDILGSSSENCAYNSYKTILEKTSSENTYLKQIAKQMLTDKILNNISQFIQIISSPYQTKNQPINLVEISYEATLLRVILGDQMLKTSGSFSKVLFMEAVRCLSRQTPEKYRMPVEIALMKLDTALLFEQNAVYGNCLKAMIFQYEKNDGRAAELEYRKAVTGNPNFYAARMFLMGNLSEQGKFTDVLDFSLSGPGAQLDYLYSSLAYSSLGKVDSAQIFYNKAANTCYTEWEFPDSYTCYWQAANFYFEYGLQEYAERCFKDCFRVLDNFMDYDSDGWSGTRDDRMWIHHDYASFLMKQKRESEAIQELEHYVELGEYLDAAEVKSNMGKILEDPTFASLRGNREFKQMLQKVEKGFKSQ
jgi:tetratricopeptide (TPR) repeat protein